jgi:phenylpropionate dioxygenase-like ring-hydroxylating dioxygenase large terminal subunit
MQNSVLPPFPNGWYALAVADTIAKGEMLVKRFVGQDVILFRTESGEACVTEAHCPHLGAHFGFGGKVVGECLRCPFHNFEFNTEGTCTKTGYGTPPPPKAILKTFPVRERNGFILVFYHADGIEPDWEIPEEDTTGWLPFKWVEWELKSHPQETAENSVDIGHFSETHGYFDVAMITEPTPDGAYLTAKYAMSRKNFLGKMAKPVRIEFTAHAHGLGYSFVEAKTLNYGIETRHYVQNIPTEDGKIILRIASRVKKITEPQKINPLLYVIPRFLINKIISSVVFSGYKHDVHQDFAIWENKKYIVRTPLAQGDGPIGLYRKWAKQFYSPSAAVALES